MVIDPPIQTSLTRKNIQQVFGTAFTDGNIVSLLWKGPESFRIIFKTIQEAKHFICLQFYIFRNDETGKELAEILKQKASDGIKVYILFDHFGSFWTPKDFWKDLEKAGVEIRASRPFKWINPLHYIHRDHRKLIIVDGTTSFTGGLNIANEYRGHITFRKKEKWRDTGLILRGPITKSLLGTFIESWQIWKGTFSSIDASENPHTDGLPVLPVFASSAKGRRRMRMLLYFSINNSRNFIYLTTAYFTPSRRMMSILEDAVLRGVNVKLLLPGKSDVSAPYYAGRYFFSKLLSKGIEIYTYSGEILHAKTSVFDGMWTIIGSANLDFQSLRRNDEGNVGIIDKNFGTEMIRIFFEDLASAEKITIENWRKRPFCEKIKEVFFAIFRRRL